jgi:hypothetical protein
MATDVPPLQFSFACAFGMIQMPSPECQLSPQPIEIEIGKRAVRAADIAHGTLQNRARTHMVAFGLVMKSDRQLNHALDMQPEMPTRGEVARQRTPDVFENFMRVEKVGAVEQIETSVELRFVGQRGHSGPASSITQLLLPIYMFP